MDGLKRKMKTMTKGGPYITSILAGCAPGVPFRHAEIELLIGLHPNPDKNAGHIEHLEVRIDEPFSKRTLFIKTVGREPVSVSYKTCVRVLFGKYVPDDAGEHEKKATMGMRNAIALTSRMAFYTENITVGADGTRAAACARCGAWGSVHVDHEGKCFQQIVDDFMHARGTAYASVQITEANEYENNAWYVNLTDDAFKNDWIEHHDREASFRFLCGHCNSSLGSSGYKKARYQPLY